jgi:hypothetical protein
MSEPAEEFTCLISRDLMRDPVFCADGYVYDRIHITNWLGQNPTSPITRERMSVSDMVAHKRLREKIEKWCADSGVKLPPIEPPPKKVDLIMFTARETAKILEIRMLMRKPYLAFYPTPGGIISEPMPPCSPSEAYLLRNAGCRMIYYMGDRCLVKYDFADDRPTFVKILFGMFNTILTFLVPVLVMSAMAFMQYQVNKFFNLSHDSC